ncbi:MAG: hypothetical protein IIT53_02950 [Fibrobacter sp.]|nr:hypothetical protein [Fibrobacter sp.]
MTFRPRGAMIVHTVKDWWAEFSSMDLVATIWGDNKSKKMMKASEQRFNENPQD